MVVLIKAYLCIGLSWGEARHRPRVSGAGLPISDWLLGVGITERVTDAGAH